jgi:negative regulator of replication initiation
MALSEPFFQEETVKSGGESASNIIHRGVQFAANPKETEKLKKRNLARVQAEVLESEV